MMDAVSMAVCLHRAGLRFSGIALSMRYMQYMIGLGGVVMRAEQISYARRVPRSRDLAKDTKRIL